MKYDCLSSSTVKITLSDEDMKEYSLCAESIALRTAETKRSLARLLKKIQLFEDCHPERLFLEAFPCVKGGCVLYVSSLGIEAGELYEKEQGASMIMCTVESLSLMIRLCSGLVKLMGAPEACIYRSTHDYSIVVTTGNSEAEKIRRFMREYGRVTRSASEIYSLAEYASPVCTKNACVIFAGLS